MEALQIQLEKRTTTGKGPARKARAAGKVPGILYGHGKDPLMFDVESHGFGLAIEKSAFGRNQVFALRGVDRDVDAIIKDIQVHPVNRKILHVDFIEVNADDKVRVEVEVVPKGRAAGQSAGGTLQLLKRTVKIDVSPAHIPSTIDIDITKMQVGETTTVGDLPMPETASPVGDPRVVSIFIKPPRVAAKAADEDES